MKAIQIPDITEYINKEFVCLNDFKPVPSSYITLCKGMKFKIKLIIGDWSDDGHGKYEDFYIECNKTRDDEL